MFKLILVSVIRSILAAWIFALLLFGVTALAHADMGHERSHLDIEITDPKTHTHYLERHYADGFVGKRIDFKPGQKIDGGYTTDDLKHELFKIKKGVH